MILDVITVSLCIVSIILSVMAFNISTKALLKEKARDNSTHSVQYVPIDYSKPTDENGFEVMTKELKEKLELDDIEV